MKESVTRKHPAAAPQEGEIADTITVDLNAIPEHVWDSLVVATLDRYKAFVQIPGNAEWLDQRIAVRKAREESTADW